MAFDPQERVHVVRKDGASGQGPSPGKKRTGSKGKTKGKAKATTARETQTAAAPAPASPAVEATAAPPPEAKAATTKRSRRPRSTAGAKKLSALDAAAQVLAEAGTPMTCPELIQALAAQGLWTSPGGKTPAATLYSAMLREIQTKGGESRFRKSARGKFEATNSQ